MTEHPFPALSDLVEEYATRGRKDFALRWSTPVLIRRADAAPAVEETPSYHTKGSASMALVEEAVRRGPPVEDEARPRRSETAFPGTAAQDPTIRVDDVIPLHKRPDATTFLDRIGIGRTPNVDVSIPLPRISKYHAYVSEIDGALCICDARSTFGTLVEGEKLDPMIPRPLEDGAAVELGPYAFRYHSAEGFIDFVARLDRVRGLKKG